MRLQLFFASSLVVTGLMAVIGLPALAQSPFQNTQISPANRISPAPSPQTPQANAPAQRSVSAWLMRIHEASRRKAYLGTFVVSSGGVMATSRIWHVCDGEQQIEQVDTLTGAPRSTFRRNHQVLTLDPQSRVATLEQRESMGMFPGLLKTSANTLEGLYTAQHVSVERVAGFDSDVVEIAPRDKFRFGYRIWSEKKTGLAVKVQTLDGSGYVLEQVAFSELQLDAPVSMGKLAKLMANTDGYRIDKPEMVKTSAEAQGWIIRSAVDGFSPMNCYRRTAAGSVAGQSAPLQCIFSDGLASVSLFIEAFDSSRHTQEGLFERGASNALSRRIPDKAGNWWLTAVGEVPAQTLFSMAQSLERKK
jgi:sigma-E factor negative regulatory protein RseB